MYPGQPGFNPNQQQQQQQQYGQPPQQYGQPPMQQAQFQQPHQGQFQQVPPQGQFQQVPPQGQFQQQPMLAQPMMGQPQQQQPMMGYGMQPQQQGYGVGTAPFNPQQAQQFAQQQANAIAQQQALAQQQAYQQQHQQHGQPQQFYPQQGQQPGGGQQQQFMQQQFQQQNHQLQEAQQKLEASKAAELQRQSQAAQLKAREAGMTAGQAQAEQKNAEAAQQQAAKRATVHDAPNFNAVAAACNLRKAMKGFGCDKKAVAEIIGTCSNRQRQEIIQVYPQQSGSQGRDLIKDLKSELRGNFEMLVKSLMRTPASYDASELRKAMKGVGCDEEILIEILCTRTPEQLEQVKVAFSREYGRDLVQDVRSETKTALGKSRLMHLLENLLTKPRDADGPIDHSKVALDAQLLVDAGEKRMGTDQQTFIDIFSARSYSHLAEVFVEYQKRCHYDIRKSIKREMGTSDFAQALQAIVGSVRDLDYFFAKKLKKAMKGVGTKDRTLTRVVVSRSEIDMADIKDQFAKRDDVGKGQTLAKWIKDDAGGEFEKLLLVLIDGKARV